MGKAFFTVNTVMTRTVRLMKIMMVNGRKVQVQKMKALRRYTLYIVYHIFLGFFPFLSDLLSAASFILWENASRSISDAKKWIETIVKEATSQGRSEIYTLSEKFCLCVLSMLKEAPEDRFLVSMAKTTDEISSRLKICNCTFVGIFEQICWCFNKVFLISLRYTQQLFFERPLWRCFLHNDHLPYFK